MPAHWSTGKRFLRFAELLSVNISSASQPLRGGKESDSESGRVTVLSLTRCGVCLDYLWFA